MMQLAINGRFLLQRMSGVQRVAHEYAGILTRSLAGTSVVTPNRSFDRGNLPGNQIKSAGFTAGHLWEQVELPLFLNRSGKPLLLNITGPGPICYQNTALVVHDVSIHRFPEWFSWRYRQYYQTVYPLVIRKARLIITVSEFSRKEILSLFDLDPGSVKVCHPCLGCVFEEPPAESKARENYILAVSSLDPRKNLGTLIKAFNLLNIAGYELRIVGAAHKAFASSGSNISANKPAIRFLGYVSDDELRTLYRNAACFVYPSLYEGFGLPPLEAMACGCPTVVSDRASLPEVCGDAVVYADPSDPEAIADGIRRLLSDSALASDKARRGYLRSKVFSREATERALIGIIKSLS